VPPHLGVDRNGGGNPLGDFFALPLHHRCDHGVEETAGGPGELRGDDPGDVTVGRGYHEHPLGRNTESIERTGQPCARADSLPAEFEGNGVDEPFAPRSAEKGATLMG